MKHLVTIIFVLVVGYVEAAENQLPSYLEGKWGWGNCENNIHTIKYSQNKEFLEFIVNEGSYFYYIAGTEEKGLKVVMLSENRFDSNNNPVHWYIVFEGNDKYYWLRSDRKENDLRGPISRCK